MNLAKSVFQLHGVTAAGEVVVRREVRRLQLRQVFAKLPACLVGTKACASSHYWARELIALGHEVRLMPAQYVKPYLKRGKNDAVDAEAIREAVTRPTMRFVAIKTRGQQSAMMLHRVRLILSRQRTQLLNALRAHLAQFGIMAPIRRLRLEQLLQTITEPEDARLPAGARAGLQMLVAQLTIVKAQILENNRLVMADARSTEVGGRLMGIAWAGPLLASAFVASVAAPGIFQTGRDLTAWIGLVPRQNSSGGKEPLGSICKADHGYLRQMLVVGAMTVIRHAQRSAARRPWLTQLLASRCARVVAIAFANKIARPVWAMMVPGEPDREPLAV